MKASTTDDLYPLLLNLVYKNIQKNSYGATSSDKHPVFFGCCDWHSSVHSHWTLVRISRLNPSLPLVKEIIERFKVYFTSENLEKELSTYHYLAEQQSPYGYSWLLALVANIYKWDIEESKDFLNAFSTFESFLKKHFVSTFKAMEKPARYGMHENTAFALILLYHYGKTVGDEEFTKAITDFAIKFFYKDESFEEDDNIYGCYITSSLCVLHIMSLIMEKEEFIEWVNKRNWKPVLALSLIHICRCRRIERCRSRWSPYH
eukprot:TRINITY_DN6185_c0_g2_i3.p1 TRINITY_DN6185_c0_g2~~TRINITY_DN6185_c0_g2_i3.p1  ORF type:complete len:261 (+),score=66.73 TRINITY_DN6185_c0_g2_i3:171-953(+)